MTVQKQALRAIIFHGADTDAEGMSAFRLLSDLGHSVTPTHSTQDASRLLGDGDADLLIVYVHSAEEGRLVDWLSDIPSESRPREVAIVSDQSENAASRLRSKFGPARVHVLLKPLHVHGLLNIVRQLESHSDGDLLH
jgi:hypothetical protein